MRRTSILAAAVLAVACAGGCSPGGAAPTASTRPPASASGPTPSARPSSAPPSPTPSQDTADQGAPVGTEYTFDDTANGITVKVAATSYKVAMLTGENQELL